MKIFKHKIDLKKELIGINSLSFIPTMGGLHAGHKSLIQKAKKKLKRSLFQFLLILSNLTRKKTIIFIQEI